MNTRFWVFSSPMYYTHLKNPWWAQLSLPISSFERDGGNIMCNFCFQVPVLGTFPMCHPKTWGLQLNVIVWERGTRQPRASVEANARLKWPLDRVLCVFERSRAHLGVVICSISMEREQTLRFELTLGLTLKQVQTWNVWLGWVYHKIRNMVE